jgi:hypothetical protein
MNYKKYSIQFILLIFGVFQILLFQNCSKNSGDIKLISTIDDASLVKITYFVEKGSTNNKIKLFVGNDQQLKDKIFQMIEANLNYRELLLLKKNENPLNDKYIISPENKSPLKL